ncbi:hypothetical protein CHUAL_010260 [Chamberlinius hualienensis]
MDSRPIVIPILSSMFGFPVLALVVICALRYRAKRARLRSHLKRARKSAIYRGKHIHRKPGNHPFNSTRLKVIREPPTLTELSVIGYRGPSSTSDEDGTIDCRGISCADGEASQDHGSQDYSSSDSHSATASPSLVKNGGVTLAFQTTPLDILSGTTGLEFSYTVVEHC